jgi:hypothetical protein
MVFIDIITNPFNSGLTKKEYYPFYLLVVDAFSHFSALLGLNSINADSVFSLLQAYQTMFRPTMNADMHPSIHANRIQFIRSDAGTQFTSDEFIRKCLDNHIVDITFRVTPQCGIR